LKVNSNVALATVSGLLLTVLYLAALTRGVITGAVFPATPIEQAILGTLFARLVVILAVPRLRNSTSGALNIMSAEVLLLPVLVFVSFLTSDPLYSQLIRGIFFAWPAAFMVVSPLYTIPKLVRRISLGASLATVLPALTSLFALLTFLDIGLGNNTPGIGLSDVTKFALLSAVGTASPLAITAEMIVTGVVALAAMVLYSLRRDSTVPFNDSILAVALVGTLIALTWGIVATNVTSSAQLVLGVPALTFIGLIWGLSRGR
jgi:hypothetical protein